jgi:mRNA interferase RelE/StbE
MAVDIIFSNYAFRNLKKLKRSTAKQIVKSIISLKDDPQEDIIRIADSNYYKMRVGDFKVVFDLEEGMLRILAVKASPRG